MLLNITNKEKTWGMLTHLSILVGLFLFIPGMIIIPPLIIWLIQKDTMPFVNDQGKEALNFTMSVSIYMACLFIFIGFVLVIYNSWETGSLRLFEFLLVLHVLAIASLFFFCLIFAIIASGNALAGKHYRYPLTIRFFR